MPEIRPLAEDDLPAVSQLLTERHPGWRGDEDFLDATVLNHPWADPETPSLVAIGEDGQVVGFIGVQARRIRFAGDALSGVCCSHLVVAAPPEGGAAGALLLGRLLRGPQAVTWSDSANEAVVRIWRAFGGQLDHARACDWMLVLHPVRWVASGVRALLRRESIGRDRLPVGAFPVQPIARRIRGFELPAPDPRVSSTEVEVTEIIDGLPGFAGKWPGAAVDHDREHLEHLFGLIRRRNGPLTCRLVRRDARPIGWYAYLPGNGRATRVLHIAADDRNVDGVLGELAQTAAETGSTVLAGRLEPHLDDALRRRLAILGLARQPVIHARDPELRAALSTRASLLTQLDSEWFVS